MLKIDKLAIVDPKAELGKDVEIGPYAIIGPDAIIGDRTSISSHAVVEGCVSLGTDCQVGIGAVIGGMPQDVKYRGERSYVRIGNNNVFREYVTIHRATGEDKATAIGDNNMIMAYGHVGHNCVIGNGVMMANMVNLGGHVLVEDKAVIGGLTGVHQFVRIGTICMIGGASRVIQDIPPYMLVDGRPTKVYGLNSIGMRRGGISSEVRLELKRAYKLLFRSNNNLTQALEEIEATINTSRELNHLIEFLKTMGRGICRESRAQSDG
ncbi:MAG: acyl-ACP--UDP-N-acetylglucosamine O-acyltransferase [bacterium]|jgi:UDP-N-acetylglucosamine acyltransferase|nr:acyl-ACP--UDP-N-acetylglucosamine O-acyltransferase [bacterium]MDD3805224.1 acyl-ACP--UDP-N-acetylglucosamine O-acyltransferase [bacterium]MDD4153337.1 acyl-ACP--UDP-N-acetylglucosamine O-acyltransferase [bacterium]MDD4557990.1 acyl-ACP--UDP-N-acetylglucosamine O-acyltransferase [bacterium]